MWRFEMHEVPGQEGDLLRRLRDAPAPPARMRRRTAAVDLRSCLRCMFILPFGFVIRCDLLRLSVSHQATSRRPVEEMDVGRIGGEPTASPALRTRRGGRRAMTAVPATSSDTSVSEPSGSTTSRRRSRNGAPPPLVPDEVLGPHAQQHALSRRAGRRSGQAAARRRQQVHRRRADEARDEDRWPACRRPPPACRSARCGRAFRITMRSASVIASTWSCVT